ncbi:MULTISPECIES: protein kinase domain-containing protein [unclassified Corallococcus]|uniref:protein kinase domain-containing protein n=1 Tax=unclassified Corallococcus TaxID=2685029 RepID=UPI001A90AAA5|nr:MULTISPECIES: protein kinase [unclassified Corallococcus]MBN9687339.1 serine/threonine protein kinase [Corallococcus sp. NCSPR001]WAS88839.1 protein kinase [Corallococcus sp. NCRR]
MAQPNVPIPDPAGASTATLLQPYGQYVLVRKLAEGGMAEIFLAKLLGADGFERNVVLKRMLPTLSAIPDFVEMFRDEARLAAKLSHPHIVQIHELGFTDGCYYICMEYLAGEDFSTTLRLAGRRRQYVPLPMVLRVLIDAARGLHFAHAFTNEQGQPLNVVHRDVSPSNLYVTYQGQVKVLDFGIAKAESRLVQTRTGVVKGKYIYMAPEQAQGKEVDPRADVFSLGVSLYEAVTHVRPFSRENDLAVLNALLQCEFEKPRALRADLPQGLEDIILKAMAFKPEDRYATAEDFAVALEAFASDFQGGAASAPALGTFLRNHFGEERVTEKTRIPTMATLTAARPTDPEFAAIANSGTNTYGQQVARPSSTGVRTLTSQNKAAPVQAQAPAPEVVPSAPPVKPASRRWLLGVVGGLGLVAAGVAFVVARPGGGAANVTPPPPVQQAIAPATPAGTQAPAVAAQGTQGTPAQGPEGTSPGDVQGTVRDDTPGGDAVATSVTDSPPVDDGAEDTPHRKVTKRPAAKEPVTLGIDDIQRVVSGGRSKITGCFERYKSDLPAASGEVQVELTIVSSGKVRAGTRGPLASTPVGRCLEAQAQSLRFPVHRDQEVTVLMPFSWKVTQ